MATSELESRLHKVRKTITDANESRNNLSEKIRLLEDRVRAQDTVIEELNNGDIS